MEDTLTKNGTHMPVNTTTRKKIKVPLVMQLIRWTFPKLEALFPHQAHRLFAHLFFRPLRYPIPPQERAFIATAQQSSLFLEGKEIFCYTWGEGPAILFVHGWAGRTSQFKTFVNAITTAGYRAVAFDAPAHGMSAGKTTSIIDFKDAILMMEKEFGPFTAVVAHSLGGAASLYALTEGLNARTLITIATPTMAEEILEEVAYRLNSSMRAAEYLKHFIRKNYGLAFDELMALHFIKTLPSNIQWMIIHDLHDKEAAPKNADLLLQAYPQATFLQTTGLGHVRILRDDEVITAAIRFITQTHQVTGSESGGR